MYGYGMTQTGFVVWLQRTQDRISERTRFYFLVASRRMPGHHQLFISGQVVNLHANARSIGQNKRRKGSNWPSGVDKNRFSDFLKF